MGKSITRKTCYALGILAVACSLAGALAVLAGQAYALLDNVAFVLAGLMFLLLAAIKENTKSDKGRYFLCFVVLLFSVVPLPLPVLNSLLASAVWPLFFWQEVSREETASPSRINSPMRRPARLDTVCELLRLVCWLVVFFGGVKVLALTANLLFFLCCVVRAWGVLMLYRHAAAAQSK